MKDSTKHSALAWGLIAAQLLVIILSQGRMVVCHKANGSSHVELVAQVGVKADHGETCVPSAASPVQSFLTSCSDGPCVDELLSLGHVLSRSRCIESGHGFGLVPIDLSVVIVWAVPTESAGVTGVVVAEMDSMLLDELQIEIRSTVLVL